MACCWSGLTPHGSKLKSEQMIVVQKQSRLMVDGSASPKTHADWWQWSTANPDWLLMTQAPCGVLIDGLASPEIQSRLTSNDVHRIWIDTLRFKLNRDWWLMAQHDQDSIWTGNRWQAVDLEWHDSAWLKLNSGWWLMAQCYPRLNPHKQPMICSWSGLTLCGSNCIWTDDWWLSINQSTGLWWLFKLIKIAC